MRMENNQGCKSSSFKGTSYRLLKSNTFQLQGTCSKILIVASSYSAKKERTF